MESEQALGEMVTDGYVLLQKVKREAIERTVTIITSGRMHKHAKVEIPLVMFRVAKESASFGEERDAQSGLSIDDGAAPELNSGHKGFAESA
jgi:hypothetical protein